MPTRFLSRAELARLGAFPEAIDRDDLAEPFRLSGDDLEFVRAQRGAASQLGIALQLCALRWLGFIPEDLAAAPGVAVESLAVALDGPARAVFDYAVRSPTRREHRLAVRAHAGWRAFGDPEAAEFRAWLAELALEHDRPAFLFTRACEELRGRRIERPAIDRLSRLVAWARERARERTFELPQRVPPAQAAGHGKTRRHRREPRLTVQNCAVATEAPPGPPSKTRSTRSSYSTSTTDTAPGRGLGTIGTEFGAKTGVALRCGGQGRFGGP